MLLQSNYPQWAATWTWPKILEFYFLNELWQYYQHALKPRNPKFHKVLMITLQVMRVFVQVFTYF
jgi:hypothetical protein